MLTTQTVCDKRTGTALDVCSQCCTTVLDVCVCVCVLTMHQHRVLCVCVCVCVCVFILHHVEWGCVHSHRSAPATACWGSSTLGWTRGWCTGTRSARSAVQRRNAFRVGCMAGIPSMHHWVHACPPGAHSGALDLRRRHTAQQTPRNRRQAQVHGSAGCMCPTPEGLAHSSADTTSMWRADRCTLHSFHAGCGPKNRTQLVSVGAVAQESLKGARSAQPRYDARQGNRFG